MLHQNWRGLVKAGIRGHRGGHGGGGSGTETSQTDSEQERKSQQRERLSARRTGNQVTSPIRFRVAQPSDHRTRAVSPGATDSNGQISRPTRAPAGYRPWAVRATGNAPCVSAWLRGISRCADWRRYGSVFAQPPRDRAPGDPPASSDYSSAGESI